jgi:hypothetical protein
MTKSIKLGLTSKWLLVVQEYELAKQTAFTKSEVYSKRIPEFLRTATEANLTDTEWKKLIDDLKRSAENRKAKQ